MSFHNLFLYTKNLQVVQRNKMKVVLQEKIKIFNDMSDLKKINTSYEPLLFKM